jgi:protein O-mannosyl-transferase
VITAFVVCLFFAVHPMHVESAAWISGRKDLLYTAFYLLSLLVYLRYLDSGRQKKHYRFALALFVLSLLSKSAAVTLPVLLLLVDYYRGRPLRAGLLLEKIPFFLLAILFGVLAILSQHNPDPVLAPAFGVWNSIVLGFYAASFYMVKFFVPVGLSALHAFPQAEGAWLPWVYYVAVVFFGLIALMVFRRHQLRKETAFGFLFFLAAIGVTLYVPSGSAVAAERYTYLPYIGLAYMLGQWVTALRERRSSRAAITILALAILLPALAFSALSWMRIPVWKDTETLFSDVVRKYPDEYKAYWVRGNFRKQDGNMQGALKDFNQVIRLQSNFPDVFHNRGLIYEGAGELRAAFDDYNRAIGIDPDFAYPYCSRGNIYAYIGDTLAAMRDYTKAIELNPRFALAYSNRGYISALLGDLDSAMRDLNEAVKLNPLNPDMYFRRAYIFSLLPNHQAALDDYSRCIGLDPEDAEAYWHRGYARMHLGDSTGATEDWRQAMALGYYPM